MGPSDYTSAYQSLLATLLKQHGRERAMELVVGGEFERIGRLERALVIAAGLRPEHTIVDVGCGSGRLAWALRDYVRGYVGTDILSDALSYARERARRPEWRFIETHESIIPVPDRSADMICFFSVFTHLLDEDVYRFLAEARRASVIGGRIVFSFLDFDCISHWTVFENTLADRSEKRVLNKFMSKSAVRRMAAELDLRVEALIDGEEPWIPFRENPHDESSAPMPIVAFGQSIGILRVE